MASDRIDPRDPLPGYREPSGRWATPFQEWREGRYVWTVARRSGCPLTTRESLAGLSSQLYADTREELARLVEREDATADMLRTAPPEWSERTSGSGAPRPADGGDAR